MKWPRVFAGFCALLFAVIASAAAAPTPDEFFGWAETLLPEKFPKGPATSLGGDKTVEYSFRCYSTGNCLAAVTKGSPLGGVYVFIDGKLSQYGVLSDYTCAVKPGECGGTSKAGTFEVSAAGQFLRPDYAHGEITYLGGADGKGYSLAPAKVAKVCFVSNRKGWGVDAQACAVPAADGSLKMSGMCLNDEGLVTVWRNDGVVPTELWVDFASSQGWKLAGDLSPKLVTKVVDGKSQQFVQYGDYKPAKVVYDKAPGQLTIRFGSDCLGGFVYEQTPGVWKPAPLVPGPLRFIWNSSTPQEAFLDWDAVAKEHVVNFSGLTCGQQTNVSVYKPKTVVDGKVTVWEDKPYAWLGVPDPELANPLWTKGTSVDFVVKKLLGLPEERSIVLGCGL